MRRKRVLLSIALILAGFLIVPAQNRITMPEQLKRQSARFEYPDFEKPKLPTPKKTESDRDWWKPDTVRIFDDLLKENIRFIFKYNSQGLVEECIQQSRINLSSTDSHIYYTYTYDSNNNVLTLLIENCDLYTYTYDSNNNKLTELHQKWENNSWIYSSKIIYTYDSNNNVLTELRQTGENNSLVNSILFTYTYDFNNNRLTRASQSWQPYYNSWGDNGLITYTYDSNNNLLTESIGNHNIYTYTYDSNNNRLTCIYDESTYSEQTTYTYDSNHNMLTELLQIWINNS